MSDVAPLLDLIAPEAEALGFNLVRVIFFGSGDERTLQIMAERPETGQLAIADCAALSRRISDRFDAMDEAGDGPIDGAYRLEVSSPGIDRPLTRAKDFAAWIGHDAKVQLHNAPELSESGRKSLAGPIMAADGDAITVQDRKAGDISFTFAQVEAAKLLLTNRLIAASRPLDASGADEFEEILDETPEEQDV